MRNFKKTIKYLFITLASALLLPLGVKAAEANVLGFYDEVEQKYLFYTDSASTTCKYGLNNSDTKPGLLHTCTKDSEGHFVIEVDLINKNNATHLWIEDADGNELVTALSLTFYYNSALPSSVLTLIDGISNQIKVSYGEDKITITDTGYENYKYIIARAKDSSEYQELVTEFLALSGVQSPFVRIQSMKAFHQNYITLLPNSSDSRWQNSQNNIIEEPKVVEFEYFVIWIMGYNDSGEPQIDMFVMEAEGEESEVVKYVDTKLPYTGLGYTLEILITANVALLTALLIRREKLAKTKNAKKK